MFSGIVRRVGVVVASRPCDFGRILQVDPGDWKHCPGRGESIAVNGCCLTATGDGAPPDTPLRFDVIRQTLEVTTLGDLRPGEAVNLEPAVTATTMLSGHIVQGHIDGIGTVAAVTADASERRLRIEVPAALGDLIIEKGSIAVDGVSLTVAALGDTWFEVALVPTTIESTSLGRLEPGRRVNLETDYIVKTVVSWMKRQRGERLREPFA